MKMNQKIIIIALAFTLPITAFAISDEKCTYNGHKGNRLERMTKNLGLTADQKAKLEPIFKQQGEKFKALHEETHTLVTQVLTKEQITKWDEMKKQHHDKWQNKHGESKDSTP